MKLEKIVVAVDFSEQSDVAVQQALDVARHVGAALTLVHVGSVPDRPVGTPASMHTTVADYLRIVDEYLAEDRRRLEELRERLLGQGVEISHMVIDGLPDKGICKAAEELGADLIVTGTHGRTGIKRFMLGSVAERVSRLSSTSVMVARPGKGASGGYRRILVPTDFSDSAGKALELAGQVAGSGATIDVLHCWYLPPMSYPYYAPTKSAAELVSSIRESITSGNEDLGKEFMGQHGGGDHELSFHQVEAAPANGILEWMEDHEYDLVVMGSHGRRGPARLLLGSVAEKTIRHAPCSVLVVHDGAKQAEEQSPGTGEDNEES